MNSKKLIFSVLLAFSLVSYGQDSWVITKATSVKIPIDSQTEKLADKSFEAYLQPLKEKLGAKMNVVIGQAVETMRGRAPESLLSNWNADVYRQAASEFMGSPIDISVVNLGGLRTVIPEGNITVGKIYELMPFENELVIVWLRGNKLAELIEFFAQIGGEGVSGIKMEITNGKAENVTINGQQLDPDKLYTIGTSDYVAGGNDKMVQMAQYEKRVNTNLKLRDVLLYFIKKETAKGNKIQSKLDGRIKID
jgi:2',3'-cyclic-nucleotide 2'-phosphodiesterase (5'-nucleotidase family)